MDLSDVYHYEYTYFGLRQLFSGSYQTHYEIFPDENSLNFVPFLPDLSNKIDTANLIGYFGFIK